MPEYIGTGGYSTSPPLCGCVLNISEGKEKCAYHQTQYIFGDVDHSNAVQAVSADLSNFWFFLKPVSKTTNLH